MTKRPAIATPRMRTTHTDRYQDRATQINIIKSTEICRDLFLFVHQKEQAYQSKRNEKSKTDKAKRILRFGKNIIISNFYD